MLGWDSVPASAEAWPMCRAAEYGVQAGEIPVPLCKAMVCGFGVAVCGLSVNASLDGASEASPLQLAALPCPPNYLST